jgi:protein-arginine deiminase
MTRTLPIWIIAIAGCNGAPAPVVDVMADSNRSGLIEPGDATEDQGEDTWDAKHGAVFLANLDDDDKDGKADADDDVVNGAADIDDLAPIAIRAWPEASKKAAATLSVEGADHVRLFRITGPANDPASYQKVEASGVTLSPADLIAGAQFAIEGREFVTSTKSDAWNGYVQVKLVVTDPEVKAPEYQAMLSDLVKMRVAPVLFQFNTASAEMLYHTDAGVYTQSLRDGMQPAADAVKKPITALDISDQDVWAQDFWDVAYTSKPGPGGKPVGMKIAIRSAQPDRNAGADALKQHFGPDWATFEIHSEQAASDHSYSMNSFGNYDVIPPYEKDGVKYPLGRSLFGETTSARESPDPLYADFVRAQAVQPVVNIDTSWLGVGHVDEYTSWVKAPNKRGWVMLLASPRDARTMLMGLSSSGSGAVKMFESKMAYDWSTRKEIPAAVAVDTVLANANLMAASQSAQAKVDTNAMKLREELGLADDEVIVMPFLYDNQFGGAAAFQPGTVNLLYFDGQVVIPDPFGPLVNGLDPVKEDLKKRLGAIGLTVWFADDWDTFHEGDGEVHCGTNASRDMKLAWWESGR